LIRTFILIAFLSAVSAVVPQAGVAQSNLHSILILDPEQLYLKSAFGLRVAAELEARSVDLRAENGRIEAELALEEKELSEQRPSLDPVKFRELADAFDARVEEIRARQSGKNDDLNNWVEQERQAFFQKTLPVLIEITREMNASVILDRRTVFLASDNIDITELAVIKVNAALGDTIPPEDQ